MLSFFIQALYSFVDSIFISRVSENALAAVALAFPVQNILCAVSVGVGIGMSVISARANGCGDHERANKVLNTGITMLVIFIALIMLLTGLFARQFFELQTDVEEIVESGIVYLQICCMLSQGMILAVYLEKALVCVGYSFYSMVALAVGSVINIILDPVFIFGLGPVKAMGIKGAAIATVIGQYVEFIIALWYFVRRNSYTHFVFREMIHVSRKDVGQILRIGFPSIISMSLSSLSSFMINQILLTYSTTATAAYGVWLRLQNFCYMPGYGLNNGMLPILSYNRGSGNTDRVKKTIKYAVVFNVALMVAAAAVLSLMPKQILELFDAAPNMMDIGTRMLRICLLSLPFGGFCIIIASAMQALGGERYTTLLHFMRGLLLLVPSFLVLHVLFHNVNCIWWGLLITEAISVVVAALCYRKVRRSCI